MSCSTVLVLIRIAPPMRTASTSPLAIRSRRVRGAIPSGSAADLIERSGSSRFTPLKVESVSHMSRKKRMRQPGDGLAVLPWGSAVSAEKGTGKFGADYVQIETRTLNPDEITPVSVLNRAQRDQNLLPILESRAANWSNPDRRTAEPHLRFANARTDEDLVSFLGEFGPVLGWAIGDGDADRADPEDGGLGAGAGRGGPSSSKSVRTRSASNAEPADRAGQKPTSGDTPRPATSGMRAWEHLPTLRAERERFAALVKLIGLLKQPVFDRNAVLAAVGDVDLKFRPIRRTLDPTAMTRFALRANAGAARPNGRDDVSNRRRAEDSTGEHPFENRSNWRGSDVQLEELILTDLLTALEPFRFRPTVISMGPRTRPRVEVLPDRAGGGIRRVLYGQLIRELEGSGGVLTCPYANCRRIFKPERVNQKYCCKACGLRAAAKKYYETRGRRRRTEKRAARVASPRGGEWGERKAKQSGRKKGE